MTAPTVNVTVNLNSQSGTPYAGITVHAKLDINEFYLGAVVATDASAVTNASGVAVLALFPNAPTPTGLGTQGSTYRFWATIPNGRKLDVQARVPDANCNLNDILVNTAVVALDAAALAVLQAQAYSAAAGVQAATATTQAGIATAAATTATTQAGIATTQATAAAASAAAAAGSAAIYAHVYPGSYTVEPAYRPDGSPRVAGDLYFNSVASLSYRWNGATWVASDINTANLAASSGSSLIGFIQSGTGAVARTLQNKGREIPSFEDFSGVDKTGVGDSTAGMQAALTAHKKIMQLTGTFRLTDALILQDNQCIILGPEVVIRQYTADKNIFKATSKNNVWIHANGATLYGQGGWSSLWTGVSGHEDRAIQFLGCTKSGIVKPYIKNCAVAAIALIGGSNNVIDTPVIEGTHSYGAALALGNNNQMGIYLSNSATYGNVDNTVIIAPNISGVTQGILEEAQAGVAARTGMLTIIAPVLHDIPSQHGMYMQNGNLTVLNPACSNIALSAVKLSSGDANLNMRGYTVTGLVASSLGGSMFEIDVPGTGSLGGAILTGVGKSVGYGVGITGKAADITANIRVDTAVGNAVYMTGATQDNIDITVNARNCAQDGVLINSTLATAIKLRPTLRESNTSTAASGCGIRVASASANVEIFDPDVTDASTKMGYGLFSSVAGSIIKVRGSAKFTGASDTAVRATGLITEWPTEATLSGTNGKFTSLGNVSSAQPIKVTAQTTSASNVPVWSQNLPDKCVAQVTVRLRGKLSGSAQRASYTLSGTFFRDGGGVATQVGATTVLASHASGGFAGAYALTTDGANGVVVVANSGGAATYDWEASALCDVTL